MQDGLFYLYCKKQMLSNSETACIETVLRHVMFVVKAHVSCTMQLYMGQQNLGCPKGVTHLLVPM